MDQKLELFKIVIRNLNEFTTVAEEELGGIGDDSYLFLKSLGRRNFESTSEKLTFNFFRQRIALTVQRGNAICILEAINCQLTSY